ncbi:MAG: ribosomal protein S18-alanine N-acetyltransferase [Lachnospiraceae bacterium]|nr:ribosomal protein S18-alanine N-acetyltransferase [Lachnospiraceae bacterium]
MQIDDLDQVMEIEEESFSIPWTANGFFTFLIREDALFLVSEDDNKINGYIGLICAPPEGDITNVAVRSSERNKGIGKALVSEMISRAHEKGVDDIFLEVRVSNVPAIRLYEAYGFENMGIRKNYYERPTEDAFIMKRSYGAE